MQTNDLQHLLKKHEIGEVHDNLIKLGVKNARDCAELEESDIQNMDVPLVTKKKLYKIMTEAKTLRAVVGPCVMMPKHRGCGCCFSQALLYEKHCFANAK